MWLFPLLLLLLLLPNVACATAPGPAGATAALMLTAGTNFSLGTSPTDVTTYWANGPPRQYSNFGSSLYNPTVGHIQTSTSGVALVSAGFVFQTTNGAQPALQIRTNFTNTWAFDYSGNAVTQSQPGFARTLVGVVPLNAYDYISVVGAINAGSGYLDGTWATNFAAVALPSGTPYGVLGGSTGQVVTGTGELTSLWNAVFTKSDGSGNVFLNSLGRIQVALAGTYVVTYSLAMAVPIPVTTTAWVLVNGTGAAYALSTISNSTYFAETAGFSASAYIPLQAGNYVSMFVQGTAVADVTHVLAELIENAAKLVVNNPRLSAEEKRAILSDNALRVFTRIAA